MAGEFSEESRRKLMPVSCATLTTVLFKRGLRNTFIGGLTALNPAAARMVGPAYTMRFIPSREDIDHFQTFAQPDNVQRRAIEECPAGHVLVIDSRKDAGGASGGDILVGRLWKRGVAGVVTDGGFRDSPDIAKFPFPAYHRSPAAPTILVRHHACDINLPIGCGDVPVYPGDIAVGDGEGVVIIPCGIADEVATEAAEQTVFEEFVQERVLAGETTLGLYPPNDATRERFKKWLARRKAQ